MQVYRWTLLPGVLLLLGAASARAASVQITGVAHAIDGDSLHVGRTEVRLFGIDAPEWGQVCNRGGQPWDCGAAAAAELSKLVDGKPLRCERMDTDQYGRAVARCSVGGIDVNGRMVELGYAIAYRQYSTAYVPVERSARRNRRGLWASTFEMPSLYRRDERDPARRAQRNARGRVASKFDAAPSSGCTIKGNRGSHGWIYHLPGMTYYNQTHAEEWFCTEAEAQAAGYRRAKTP